MLVRSRLASGSAILRPYASIVLARRSFDHSRANSEPS
jgi:hypothetical protein